jgi:ABC-type glycerol-3-phosphate transport system substrate-binding protein
MLASVGQAKFTDPEYAEWWSRLQELKDAECWNKDINSLDYQQGQDMFVQGKAAMIFGNDTFLKGWADTIGWDNMSVMKVPTYGSGRAADDIVTRLGITRERASPRSPPTSDGAHPERINAWFNDTVFYLPTTV